jgi:hypothetical protein
VKRIDGRLTIPDGHLRAARVLQSNANPSNYLVVADLQAEGYEREADIVVWFIEERGAPGTLPDEDADGLYAVNPLASIVNILPDKPMSDVALAQLNGQFDACRTEVLREARAS